MGLKHSSCYSSNCLDNEFTGGDEPKQYSEISHHNFTKNNTPSGSNNSINKVDKDIQEIDQTFDEMIQQTSLQIDNYDNNNDTYLMEHNNNDSDSNESVLTAISPTKERHFRWVNLYLNLYYHNNNYYYNFNTFIILILLFIFLYCYHIEIIQQVV